MPSRLRPTFAWCVALLWVGCATAGQPPGDRRAADEGSPAFELCPGVVVVPDPVVVYAMRPHGGIEAVDGATGETIWSTAELAKPLTVAGRRLVVQVRTASRAEVLPIAFLDVGDGSLMPGEVEIPLPAGVRALTTEQPGESFSARGWVESGALVVAWTSVSRELTGMAPPPGAAPVAVREAAVRVDLDSGRVERLPEGVREERPTLPPVVQALVDSGELRQAPWKVRGLLAATVDRAAPGGSRRVVLRRWDAATGAPLADVELFEGSPIAQLPSADHRHVLIVSPAADGAGTRERYRWSIFALASGERVGELRYHQSADRFSVQGTVLLHRAQQYGRRVGGRWVEHPLAIVAYDLRRGVELWNRSLGDTSYRGPQPPSP